jgi:hypothetical protein
MSWTRWAQRQAAQTVCNTNGHSDSTATKPATARWGRGWAWLIVQVQRTMLELLSQLDGFNSSDAIKVGLGYSMCAAVRNSTMELG